MKRFIQHEELARDSRFTRQTTVLSSLIAQLPDDVSAVVALFEKFAPLIEKATRGTQAEPLFDAYGPGFGLMTNTQALKPGDPATETRLKLRMHGIFVGELQALEGAGRSLWDFPDAPRDFKMNMARQCWDELRHVQIYEKLLEHVGGTPGMFPESTFLFECACADDPALRVAGVNRGLEGLACDVFRDMIRYAEEVGDEKMRQAIDYVLADELTHVRFGSDWVRRVLQERSRAPAARERVPQAGRQAVQVRRRALGEEGLGDSDHVRGPPRGRLHRGGSCGSSGCAARAPRARRCARPRACCASGTARGERSKRARRRRERADVPRLRPGQTHHLCALRRLRSARRFARAVRPLRRRGDRAPRAQFPLRRRVDDDDPRRLDGDDPRSAREDRPRQDRVGRRANRRRVRQAAPRAALRAQGGGGQRGRERRLRRVSAGALGAGDARSHHREARRCSTY